MTRIPLTFDGCVRMSSWMPSTKYVSSCFALRLSNGSTAIEGRESAIVSAGSLEADEVLASTLRLTHAVIAPEQTAADQE